MNSHFLDTDSIVEAVRMADPDRGNVTPCDCNGEPTFQGRRVGWWSQGPYVVEVSADDVVFMDGNIWNFEHAAGVMEAMAHGECFELPAARIHRITASDVEDTQAMAKRGDLLEQWSMVRPWTRADIGSYRAQLLDGNHRAAAAMALGEQHLWVYVGENYRAEVRKKDWR